MSIRISLVEDDAPTLGILADLIRSEPSFVLLSYYPDSTIAAKCLPVDKPDVVLMDINMPGMNGIECVRALKPEMATTQFLMLTVYEDAAHIFAALAAGATGYLLKGTRRAELVAAIEQIMSGGSPMSSGIARQVVQSFSRAEVQPAVVSTLSPREKDVLDLLAKGYLYKEIADMLHVSVPTVNTYIRRIYDKLQVNSRSKAVAKYLGKPGE